MHLAPGVRLKTAEAENWKWSRVAVWDVAGNGAFVNPIWCWVTLVCHTAPPIGQLEHAAGVVSLGRSSVNTAF